MRKIILYCIVKNFVQYLVCDYIMISYINIFKYYLISLNEKIRAWGVGQIIKR